MTYPFDPEEIFFETHDMLRTTTVIELILLIWSWELSFPPQILEKLEASGVC